MVTRYPSLVPPFIVLGWKPSRPYSRPPGARRVLLARWNAAVADRNSRPDRQWVVTFEKAVDLSLFGNILDAVHGTFYAGTITRIHLAPRAGHSRRLKATSDIPGLPAPHMEIPAAWENYLWRLMNGTDQPSVQRSLMLLRESFKQVRVDRVAVDDLVRLGAFDSPPAIDRETAESAFVQGFKAIEALVGDPGSDKPKKRLKLEKSLIALQIDPGEQCGFAEKKAISERIWDAYAIRNGRAAHGSTRGSALTSHEIVDCQETARLLLRRLLEHEAVMPTGEASAQES